MAGFDLDAAYAVLAGLLAGAAGGLASTAIALLALVRHPTLRARLPGGVSPAAIGIVAVNGMLIVWTLAGLVLGAVYARAAMPQFSIGVVAAVLALLGGAVFVRRRLTWPMWSAAAVAVLAFAAMLPALAALR